MIFIPINEHFKPSVELTKHNRTYSGVTVGTVKS